MKPNTKPCPARDSNLRLKPTVIHGHDRITLWLDLPELPIAKELLERHCAALTVKPEQMEFNSRWKLLLDVHQPSMEFLRLLKTAIGHDISVLITYIEVACDIPAKNKTLALLWRNTFLAAARVCYQRQPMVRYLTACYYGRRTHKGVRRRHVQALYADRPSKLNNARPSDDALPCLHIEWRASGSAALVQIGVVSLTDLIKFDHRRFWSEHLRMYQLPRKTDLGRLLAAAGGADTAVSGSALRKRAERWQERHSIKGKFVLHNALLECPELKRRLPEVPFWDWLQVTLND